MGFFHHGENRASDQLVKNQHTPRFMSGAQTLQDVSCTKPRVYEQHNWANEQLLIDKNANRQVWLFLRATSRHLMFITVLRALFMIIIAWIKVLCEHNTDEEGCLFQVIVVSVFSGLGAASLFKGFSKESTLIATSKHKICLKCTVFFAVLTSF